MSKKPEPARQPEKQPFAVMNGDWTIRETAPGVFELSTADSSQKITGLAGAKLVAALAVLAELERHLKEVK